jgi:diguanylate cyclase (GGDEF)-like protein
MSNATKPFRSLRVRLALLITFAFAALAVAMIAQSGGRLKTAHLDAGRAQLQAMANTWNNGFASSDLQQPDKIQAHINKLRDQVPDLHKISVSWHNVAGETLIVQSGHSHDPSGTKRDVTTNKVRRYGAGSSPAPIDERDYAGYREVRAEDGAHYGELNVPLRRAGRTVAALELHYDLKKLDTALLSDKRTLAVSAMLAALTLTLLVNLLLGHAVLSPLRKLGEATKRIGKGEKHARLGWSRPDEIGALASDFDRMAEELASVHSHLEAMALTDALTGLLNHRAFQERVSQELRRAERERYHVAMVALDVDHFKEINDTFGHAVGDDALRHLAKAIQGVVRPSDVCGRVGGDEFMLAITRTSAEQANQVVDRLRTQVAQMRFGPTGVSLTISAGISEFPRHALSREDLMHLADGAMYWAKSSGRNRSFIYSAEYDAALSPEDAADRVARAGLVNTVHALAKAVDAKDGYTHSHSHRVARYAAALSAEIGLEDDRMEMIRTAGVLHDVGKIGIPDAILLKPGRLTDEEFDEMKRHSEFGRDIIAGAGMDEVAKWVLHLHERFDGRGYPGGLAAEQIPLESRVLHVADAFEAMTSSRIYREALPVEEALRRIEASSGEQFDPEIAKLMVDLVREGRLDLSEDDEDGGETEDKQSILAALGADSLEGGDDILSKAAGILAETTPGSK